MYSYQYVDSSCERTCRTRLKQTKSDKRTLMVEQCAKEEPEEAVGKESLRIDWWGAKER
jgi:hypothetical protein